MREWTLLVTSFPGWTLTETRELSPRERANWVEIAREFGKVVKKNNG